jgi:hypothetical protein
MRYVFLCTALHYTALLCSDLIYCLLFLHVLQVRVHWENRVPIPRLYPPVPIMKSPPASASASVEEREEREEEAAGGSCETAPQGVWLEPLWDDLEEKFKQTLTPFELPDLQQNLPHQKLQMVNMCIICGDVASTVEEAQSVQCARKARKQLAARLEQLQKQQGQGQGQRQGQRGGDELGDRKETQNEDMGDSERDECISKVERAGDIDTDTDTDTTERDKDSGGVAAQKFSLQVIASMDVSSRDLSHITPPRLQRRLPMTSDALAQHRHLANKLRQGSSRSATENTMLRWQILYPELISDVRAFKACNNTVASTYDASNICTSPSDDKSVTFEDFVVWYGGAGVLLPPLAASSQQHIGDSAGKAAVTAVEQRKQCAEKALNERGLDGISLENLRVRICSV